MNGLIVETYKPHPKPAVGPDFTYVDYGTIVAFTPKTRAARLWADENELMQSFGRLGSSYGVPHGEYANVIDAIDAASLYFHPGA